MALAFVEINMHAGHRGQARQDNDVSWKDVEVRVNLDAQEVAIAGQLPRGQGQRQHRLQGAVDRGHKVARLARDQRLGHTSQTARVDARTLEQLQVAQDSEGQVENRRAESGDGVIHARSQHQRRVGGGGQRGQLSEHGQGRGGRQKVVQVSRGNRHTSQRHVFRSEQRLVVAHQQAASVVFGGDRRQRQRQVERAKPAGARRGGVQGDVVAISVAARRGVQVHDGLQAQARLVEQDPVAARRISWEHGAVQRRVRQSRQSQRPEVVGNQTEAERLRSDDTANQHDGLTKSQV